MSTLIVLVGLPACGKSTWAKNYKKLHPDTCIMSSDEIREEFFGNANDQSHNAEVFELMRTQTRKALDAGIDVIYDATNINRKDRSSILSICGTHHKMAIFFEVPVPICKERNRKRERVVPDFVYDRMLRKFEIPIYGEGFDSIVYLNISGDYKISGDLLTYCMSNFDQKNPHHTKKLLAHCKDVENFLSPIEDINLLTAARYHDIGKLFTQTFDESGIAHYYGHENYGAYYSLFIDYPPVVDKEKVAFYINYHMLPFKWKNATDETRNKYNKIIGAQDMSYLLAFNTADMASK